MTDLTRRTLLDPLTLDGRDYFASLLAEGQRCGLLSDRDLSRLQGESLTLLAERADAWSHGLSTSLPAERAQQLLGSVLYIVSLELKTGPTPEEAVERLRREPLAALYAAGQKRITRKLQAARTLHRQLKKTMFPTPNQFYRATLADGIDGFSSCTALPLPPRRSTSPPITPPSSACRRWTAWSLWRSISAACLTRTVSFAVSPRRPSTPCCWDWMKTTPC